MDWHRENEEAKGMFSLFINLFSNWALTDSRNMEENHLDGRILARPLSL
jgi:hypothetical protein